MFQPQALTLMNDPLVLELSKRWGKKVTTDQKDLAAERDSLDGDCSSRSRTERGSAEGL